jgi:hypothetical protein
MTETVQAARKAEPRRTTYFIECANMSDRQFCVLSIFSSTKHFQTKEIRNTWAVIHKQPLIFVVDSSKTRFVSCSQYIFAMTATLLHVF